MPPTIVITAKTEDLRGRSQMTLPVAYAEAIEEAGGLPVIIPLLNRKDSVPSVAGFADGILFSGGDDIHPRYYGEEPLPSLIISPDERTDLEMALLREVLRLRKPVLGICLGAQLINAALGGSLFQDIPAQIKNPLDHKAGSVHEISIKKGTLLARVAGGAEIISVMSAHHQSVKTPGKGLVISARSADQVVEAVEMIHYPFCLGVQWHPERGMDDPFTKKLFKEFVEMAEESIPF